VADFVPHRLAHLFRQLAIVAHDVLVVALVEDNALRKAVLEHGCPLVEAEQIRILSLPDRLDIGRSSTTIMVLDICA